MREVTDSRKNSSRNKQPKYDRHGNLLVTKEEDPVVHEIQQKEIKSQGKLVAKVLFSYLITYGGALAVILGSLVAVYYIPDSYIVKYGICLICVLLYDIRKLSKRDR